jgi:hypothetical protein
MTEQDLIARGWLQKDGRWFKSGAIMCQRNRKAPPGLPLSDAVQIEKMIDEWGKQ